MASAADPHKILKRYNAEQAAAAALGVLKLARPWGGADMRFSLRAAVVAGALLTTACAGSKMSVMQPQSVPSRPIGRLAIMPGSGVLGDAIGLELFNRGMTIIDAQEAVAIVGRAGLQEFELTSTKGFELLREKAIEAVLTAKAVDAADGTPESASVRVTDTTSGQILAGVTWQNGWGGMRGSIADRTMRKNLTQAANEIAQELLRRIRPSP